MHEEFRTTPSQMVLMLLAVAVSIVATLWIVRAATVRPADPVGAFDPPPPEGVEVRLWSGEVEVRERWNVLAITLEEGQAIHSTLPPSGFDAEMLVRFRPGATRYARVGAVLQGGSLIIMRDRQVVLSDHADSSAPRTVLSQVPLSMFRSQEELLYIFRRDGTGEMALAAVWQPEGASAPRPLPMATGRGSRQE
jgi:hypothetical protein